MSKIENINKYLKNAKINNQQLKKICYFFAYDFTASATAKELALSRQTINSYYKMMREFLIETQDSKNYINLNKMYCKESFIIKYFRLGTHVIYYIQHNDMFYILDELDGKLEKIYDVINAHIKNSLISNKKANSAKIFYDSQAKEYFVSTFFSTINTHEEFIVQRLKKFRGLNKHNNKIHVKESIIRYQHNKDFLFKSLYSIFH